MCCYQNQSHRRATWRLTTAWCGATLLMLILALMLFDQIKEIEFGKVWTVGIQFPESGKILWGHWVECRSPARKSVISRPVYLDCNIEDCHLRTLFLTSTMHCFIYYSMSRDLRPSQSTNSKDIKWYLSGIHRWYIHGLRLDSSCTYILVTNTRLSMIFWRTRNYLLAALVSENKQWYIAVKESKSSVFFVSPTHFSLLKRWKRHWKFSSTGRVCWVL